MASANGLINNNLVVNTLDGLTTVSTSGGTVDPTLYVKYAANTNDTDLSGYNIMTSHVPTGTFDLTNKTYVDGSISGLSAIYVPYTGGSANVVLTGTNKFQQAYNALTSDTTTLVNRQTLDSTISGLGAGILNSNNTWGNGNTNNFNNALKTVNAPFTNNNPGINAESITAISPSTYTLVSGFWRFVAPSATSGSVQLPSAFTYADTANQKYILTLTGCSTNGTAPVVGTVYNATTSTTISDVSQTITSTAQTITWTFTVGTASSLIYISFSAGATNYYVQWSSLSIQQANTEVVGALQLDSPIISNITQATGTSTNHAGGLLVNQTSMGVSASTFTQTGMPSGAPTSTLTFSSPTYTLSATGAFATWLGSATTYISGAKYYFTFGTMLGSQYLQVQVVQYNTAGTAYIQISDSIYGVASTSSTITGSFTAGANGSYTGAIVFYFTPTIASQNVKFNTFSMTRADTSITGNETVGGALTVAGSASVSGTLTTNISNGYIPWSNSGTLTNGILYYGSSGICVNTTTSIGMLTVSSSSYPTIACVGNSSDVCIDLDNYSTGGNYWRIGSAGVGSGGGLGNYYIYNSSLSRLLQTITSSGTTNLLNAVYHNHNLILAGQEFYQSGYAGTGISLDIGVNRSGNKQFWMTDVDYAINSSNPVVRISFSGAQATIGAVSTDGGTNAPLYVNSSLLPQSNAYSLGNYSNQYGSVYAGIANHGELQLVNSSTFIRFVPDASCVYLECGTSSSGSPVNPSVVPLYFTGMYGGNPMGGFATNGNFGCGGITSPLYTLDMGGSSANVNARNAGYNWFIAQTGLGYWDNNTRYGSGGSNWRMYGYSNLQIQGGTNASFSNGSCGFDANSTTLGAIWNTVSPPTGNVGSWNSYGGGFTIFSSSTAPGGNTAGLGIGVYNNGASSANWIVSLQPGVAWLPLTIYNSQTTFTYYGSACGYTVGAGGANVSDAREKHSINDYPSQKSLAKILKLKPKTYQRIYYDKNAKGEDHTPAPDHVKEKVHIGLLAQEVLDVNPGCVSTWINDAIKSDTETGERYGICYDDFIVHLIGAVQEHDKTITALQTQVADLTALVQQLLKK